MRSERIIPFVIFIMLNSLHAYERLILTTYAENPVLREVAMEFAEGLKRDLHRGGYGDLIGD